MQYIIKSLRIESHRESILTVLYPQGQAHIFFLPPDCSPLHPVRYGDVVVHSWIGRVVVLGMICIGVVLIPVQAGQLWNLIKAMKVLAASSQGEGLCCMYKGWLSLT